MTINVSNLAIASLVRGQRMGFRIERETKASSRSPKQSQYESSINDQEGIPFPMADDDKIRRESKNLPDAIETLTKSEWPRVA